MDTLFKPDPAVSDAAWARVIAAREAGLTGHREIAAYLILFGLRLAPDRDAYAAARKVWLDNCYVYGVPLDPFTGAWLDATITGGGQIIVGSLDASGGVAHRYSYTTLSKASEAFDRWTESACTDAEPTGWVRHQPSNRRRELTPSGATAIEWVAE